MMPFPVDQKFIVETERKLGVKLPLDYVQKMMSLNGGSIETPSDAWDLYPILDSSDKKRLARTCNDVVSETIQAREWTGFPEIAVTIGGNGGGDQLILVPRRDTPQILGNDVYWWDHETGTVHFVASSFGELTFH